MSELGAGLEALERSFVEHFGSSPACLAWAPGRVNVIGEHTDYTGGLAMPAAIDRRVLVAISEREDELLRVRSEVFGEEIVLDTLPPPGRGEGWLRYVAGLVSIFRREFPGLAGFDALISSDVPMGAGLSSSAALEVALAGGLRELFELELSDRDLVSLCRRVENEYLGLSSGLLDQMASQFSQEGSLTLIDFRDLSTRSVPAPLSDWALLILDSGKRRELATSAYESRVEECALGLKILGGALGPRLAREVSVEELDRYPSEIWSRRLRHVVEENARVLEMERLLLSGDTEKAAALLNASHASLRDLFEVSIEEMDLLQRAAVEKGCLGARMVGGGFGGCCLAIVHPDEVDGFSDQVLERYRLETGNEGRAWIVNPSAGAGAVRL